MEDGRLLKIEGIDGKVLWACFVGFPQRLVNTENHNFAVDLY